MSVRQNPNIDGRLSLDKLWAMMDEHGLTQVHVHGMLIGSRESMTDDCMVPVSLRGGHKKQLWTIHEAKRHVWSYKAHYGTTMVWDSIWGFYTARRKAKPAPKKRGPKPKEPEKRPVGRPRQERYYCI